MSSMRRLSASTFIWGGDMSKNRNWSNPRQTVRPRSTGRVPVLLCLLLACLCSLAVYRWGYEHWWPVRAKPTYTATAYVVEPDSTAGRVPLVNTDADEQRAREAADAMANLYVSDRQKEWRGRTEQSLVEARRWVEETQQRHQQSIAQLEAFISKQRKTTIEKKTVLAEAPHRNTITNPQWLKLEQQSMELIKQREGLLATRTHQHPSVIEVSDKIVEIERQMAAIPRDIPFSEEAAERDASMSVATQNIDTEDRRKIDELTTFVTEDEESVHEAELAMQDAEQRMEMPPQYSIEYAGIVKNQPEFDYGWRRLIWTTLAAGLMMAFGAGTFSFGAGIEPPVATSTEVRNMTGKSVVGTIPAEDAAADRAEISHQSNVQRMMITIGVLLILVCPVLAAWGVLGI